MAVAMALIASVPGERLPSGWTLTSMAWFIPLGLSFATVGALIEWRRSGHAIGRLLLFGGMVNVAEMALAAYAVHALFGERHLPAGEIAAWLFNVIAVGLTGVPFVLIVFLFPDGRVPLHRSRIGLVLALLTFPSSGLVFSLRPGPLIVFPAIDNPVPAAFVGRHGTELMSIYVVLGVLVFILGVSTLRERARRATGVEKQQMKWFLAGASLAGAVASLAGAVIFGSATMLLRSESMDIARFATAVGLVAIPASIGVAILRYRLYDIDVLIRRTVVYGATITIIGAGFLVATLVLQALLRPLTGGSDLAIAGSTLATVAAFHPLRRRVQDAVDRRFYRSRYDASRTLDAFTVRMRDQVEIDAVRREVLDVVRTTVQPAHASVWLRKAQR